MKCQNCFALFTEGYEYPEEYCGAGVPEDGKMATEEGCRYSAKEIRKRLERNGRLKAKEYDGYGEWYHEQQLLDAAMNEAVQKMLDAYFAGQLYLCFKDRDGKYYPLRGDGKSCIDFVYLGRCEYEAKEAAAQRTFCEKCRWKGRKQKCACCRRNRWMKDNYEAVEEDDELAWLKNGGGKRMNKIIIDGKEYELSAELVEKIKAEVAEQDGQDKKNLFERKQGGQYYYTTSSWSVCADVDTITITDGGRYQAANYCRDKELMEQRALHETLNRRLWRYSETNGGGEKRGGYFIYRSNMEDMRVGHCTYASCGDVYFRKKEVAEAAIEEVVMPFLAAHPEFVW